jgi:hypothetical protein
MIKKISLFTILVGLLILLQNCTKEPGYGGNSGIYGVVKLKRYNSDYTILKDQTVLANSEVYIIFKDGQGYGDKVKTSYDGSFIFNHLVPGDYKIYVYSSDTTQSINGQIPITINASIKKAKELINVGDIVISDNKKIKGNASIAGKVFGNKSASTYNAIHEKIYLSEVDDSTITDYTFTDYNGNYLFNNLSIGKYKVYVYSKNLGTGAPYLLIDTIATITKNNDVIKLNDFNVND